MDAQLPRFVLLRHDAAEGTHWDLMLEQEQGLATWRLGADPGESAGHPCTFTAQRLPDHRKAYLSYQGEVSGQRGCVRRVDEGTWAPQPAEPGRWGAHVRGRKLIGHFELPESLAPAPGTGSYQPG